ncbi:MAG: segregation/condensation protein A [Synechococcus sp.]|nr:segregation/condensation protein A [Synechococcus sp.]
MGDSGARVAIRLLQDAAERGDIDPWDVDVIAVVDGFLDQLRQNMRFPRLVPSIGGSYEQDLAESSEAFLAASVLVSLKAEHLESQTFQASNDTNGDDELELLQELEAELGDWPALRALPSRPEQLLRRRTVAPPPLQRPVTLGELIRQLEDIGERLDEQGSRPGRVRRRRYSDREAIAQVAALAHREKLPETTAALSVFLSRWDEALEWLNFEQLVVAWAAAAPKDLDQDRVGVFWALLFLCSQGRVDLKQQEGELFGPLQLRYLAAGEEGLHQGVLALNPAGSAAPPDAAQQAA